MAPRRLKREDVDVADRFAARCARPGFGPWARTALLSAACAAALAALAGPALAKGGASAASCQPYSAKPCLFPYPDNRLTRPDRTSATKLRVNLPGSAMPVNTKGVRIRTAAWDRNDGFSPGSTIVLHIPGLDNAAALKRTGSPITNIAQSLAKRQPVVLIDQATGTRQLIWAELDTLAKRADSTDLMIHPAKLLAEGHTFVVALRNLRTKSGKIIRGPEVVRAAARQRQAAQGRASPGGALRPHLQGAQARRDRLQQEPVRGVELHRRLAPEPDRAHAGHPQQRLRAARRHQPRRLRRLRPRAGVCGDRHQAAGLLDRRGPHPGRRDPPGPLLPGPLRCVGPAGLPLQLVQARRHADADPGQRRDDDVRVRRAQHRHRPDPGADLALRPRAAGVRGRGHGDADRGAGGGAQHRHLLHACSGAWPTTTRSTTPRPWATSTCSEPSSTACSRARSTCCTSGA